MNEAPYEWTIRALMKHAETSLTQVKGGDYEPTRVYGFYSLGNRLRLAWKVFTGEADALCWPYQNTRAY